MIGRNQLHARRNPFAIENQNGLLSRHATIGLLFEPILSWSRNQQFTIIYLVFNFDLKFRAMNKN